MGRSCIVCRAQPRVARSLARSYHYGNNRATRCWAKSPRCIIRPASLPGDSAEALLRQVRRCIRRAPITLSVQCMEEPARSPRQRPRRDALCTAIAVHFPGTVIVPSLLAGGTDARRMEALCPQVYRFSPFILPQDELLRVHGIDERLSLENLNRGVAFFRQMLQA